MTQLGEAIARYHKLLESDTYKDLAWAEALQDRMKAQHLMAGNRPISPVVRPHFITRRQYTNLVKAAEYLFSAIQRVEKMALSSAALQTRIQLLPAEKMLAAVDPGYSLPSVTSLLDTRLNNGTLRFVEYNAETPAGVAYGEALSEVFYDCPPVKEFRKKHPLVKLGGAKHLLHALLKAWHEFGGKTKKPQIGILEFRAPFQAADSSEFLLLVEYFRREGIAAEIVSPDQLEYRNGVLRRGDFQIDLIYRRMRVQEFLVRFDLSHPVVRAYRDRKVCMVNSFRSEVSQKKAIFDLLTDDAITSTFPAAERKAIRDFVPWTRMVQAAKATYQEEEVDLPDFIMKNRSRLILKPNDDATDQQAYTGADLNDTAWEKALRQAMRSPYVVQEMPEPTSFTFPVYQWGELSYKEMKVDVHPHSFLGKVHGCSSWLSPANANGFSTLAGLAPTFILDSK